jgi:hypothetical protein
MRLGKERPERPEDAFVEAKGDEVELDMGSIENSDHHAFAVNGGRRSDAQIDIFAANGHGDPAVLRESPLRDVELGHDLDARNDRGGQPVRRRIDGPEYAVDAVAHAQLVIHRFDVNV